MLDFETVNQGNVPLVAALASRTQMFKERLKTPIHSL